MDRNDRAESGLAEDGGMLWIDTGLPAVVPQLVAPHRLYTAPSGRVGHRGVVAALGLPRRVQDFVDQLLAADLIRAGRSERMVDHDIYALAQQLHGLDQHWHQRLVRAGSNTAHIGDQPWPVQALAGGDLVQVDLGPLLESWQVDIGFTLLLGENRLGAALLNDLAAIFTRLRRHYAATPKITGADLYAVARAAAAEAGWRLGGGHIGHLLGEFPHIHVPWMRQTHRICAENPETLRQPDAQGRRRHWILRLHLLEPGGRFGASCKAALEG